MIAEYPDASTEDQGAFCALTVDDGRVAARPLYADPVSRTDAVALRAAEMYERGYFCGEAVLAAVNAELGHPMPASVTRLASGFCEGGGGARHTCGALAGAAMAVGMLAGRDGPDQDWEPSFNGTGDLFRRFDDLEGTLSCATIAERHGGMGHPSRWAHCTTLCGACAGWVLEIGEERGWL